MENERIKLAEENDWLLGKDAPYKPEFKSEEEYILAQ